MRLRVRRKRKAKPSPDAAAAVTQVKRALEDTEALAEHIDEVTHRAHEAASRADQVRASNHFGAAVEVSIRRRAQHS